MIESTRWSAAKDDSITHKFEVTASGRLHRIFSEWKETKPRGEHEFPTRRTTTPSGLGWIELLLFSSSLQTVSIMKPL